MVIAAYGIFRFLFFFLNKSLLNNGDALEKAGLYDKALKLYKEELEKNPNDLETKMKLCRILVKKNFDDTAIFELEDMLSITNGKSFSEELETLELLCKLYKKCYKKVDEFLTLKKLLILDNTNIDAHMRIAEYLIGNFKLEESIYNLDKVIKLDSNNSNAIFHKGMVLIETNKKKSWD